MVETGRHPQKYNHPRKGASIKVQPIRDSDKIWEIKALLMRQPRNLCLFTLGINTAYRASELLSIRVGDVQHLKDWDRLDLRQSKTARYRPTIINPIAIDSLRFWLEKHPDRTNPKAPLFLSQRTRAALCVSSVSNLVKGWCRAVGLSGNYGSHSLRKTWGYHQRVFNGQATPLLMMAFGHKTEAQTLDYLCIQSQEIANLYAMEL